MPPLTTASIANETSWNPSHVFIRKIVVYTFFGSLAALVAMLVLMPEQRMRIMGPILQAAVTAVAWIRIRRGDGQGALRYLAYGSWLTVTVTSTMAEEADGQLNLSKAARSLQDQKLEAKSAAVRQPPGLCQPVVHEPETLECHQAFLSTCASLWLVQSFALQHAPSRP